MRQIDKIQNNNENIAIAREQAELAVERRDFPVTQDTLFLKTAYLKQGQYQLNISSAQLEGWNMQAFLVDNFQHSSTRVNIVRGQVYNFLVSNNAASYASNRFAIVFTRKCDEYRSPEYSITKVSY